MSIFNSLFCSCLLIYYRLKNNKCWTYVINRKIYGICSRVASNYTMHMHVYLIQHVYYLFPQVSWMSRKIIKTKQLDIYYVDPVNLSKGHEKPLIKAKRTVLFVFFLLLFSPVRTIVLQLKL